MGSLFRRPIVFCSFLVLCCCSLKCRSGYRGAKPPDGFCYCLFYSPFKKSPVKKSLRNSPLCVVDSAFWLFSFSQNKMVPSFCLFFFWQLCSIATRQFFPGAALATKEDSLSASQEVFASFLFLALKRRFVVVLFFNFCAGVGNLSPQADHSPKIKKRNSKVVFLPMGVIHQCCEWMGTLSNSSTNFGLSFFDLGGESSLVFFRR